MFENDERNRDRDDERKIRQFLKPNEEILWRGRPCRSRKYRNPTPLFWIFPCFFIAFALFWTFGVLASGGGVFALFGLPFIVVGGVIFYSLLIAPKKRLEKTVYALTDERVLVISETRNGIDCANALLDGSMTVNLSDLQDDSGTISFYPNAMTTMYSGIPPYQAGYRVRHVSQAGIQLYMIDDVMKVYQMITAILSHDDIPQS